ncbi:hypothetical protein EYF80_005253 [Liparis tanakae]|uniref:Uncharacterized protein n=1 Tax=Liparis tanakae TaxID=230148 RepID=A0A4Z2J4X5_9TELE|nr:hypothetical protein EYF80_005253 [Liparis tanakae]
MGTSAKPLSRTAGESRTNATTGLFRDSSSPTNTLHASAPVELRCPSTHVGNGAHDGQAIGQLLVVLVVVPLQQGFTHSVPEIVSQW